MSDYDVPTCPLCEAPCEGCASLRAQLAEMERDLGRMSVNAMAGSFVAGERLDTIAKLQAQLAEAENEKSELRDQVAVERATVTALEIRLADAIAQGPAAA